MFHFSLIQVENHTSCPPLQFLVLQAGTQGKTRSGAEQRRHSHCAMAAQTARRNL